MLKYLVTAAALMTIASAHAQMTLPGKFEVTDTGSASYTIPISVVPGTAGLEPKLSLQYDSRSGNGLLGVGWSLAGLPAITRCGRTIAQDGQAGGVAYDANDRFCLDGQRLIAVNVGTYGADGTEYRTERESFSKIVSKGTVSGGSGPSWFEVKTKAGLVMEFGNTADSKIEAQGKTSVRVWALNKTSDTKGNAFAVRYTEDNANGEYRPLRINYTGAEGTTTNNSVRFEYETRPDIVPLYQAGGLIKTTQRMTKIQAWQGSDKVREYTLGYQLSPETRRSRLISAELCDGSAACLPVSTFAWQNSDLMFVRTGNLAGVNGSYRTDAGWAFHPGDFNGDGLTDLLVTHGATGTWDIWLNQPDGTFVRVQNVGGVNGWYGAPSWTIYLADFNGDGRTDIMVSCYDGRREFWLLEGDTASNLTLNRNHNPFVSQHNTHRPDGGWAFAPGDFNGDGMADLLVTHGGSGLWELWLNQGVANAAAIITNFGGLNGWYGAPSWTIHLADFNADGRVDIMVSCYDGRREFWLAAGDNPSNMTLDRNMNPFAARHGNYRPDAGWSHSPADFNGDGLADLLVTHTSGVWEVWLNKGSNNGAEFVGNFGGNNGYYGANAEWIHQLGDFNGDGRVDVMVSQSQGRWEVWRTDQLVSGVIADRITDIHVNNGYYGWGGGSWISYVGDFNGDGRADILLICYDGRREIWTFGQPVPADAITSIQTPAGGMTQVTYKSIARGGVYTKDTSATYPVMDVQGPLYVVSEVGSSNGINATPYRSTYRYAGARADLQGRGFLGFRQMIVKDEQTGVEQATTYRQDYPFTGLVASREKKLGTALLNRSTNSYAATDLGGTRRFPYLSQSLEESWELGAGGAQGAMLPVVRTDYEYDNHPHPSCVTAEPLGNVTKVLVRTDPGTPQEHSKQTVNCYANDIGQWFLGRLIHSAVTSTIPAN